MNVKPLGHFEWTSVCESKQV